MSDQNDDWLLALIVVLACLVAVLFAPQAGADTASALVSCQQPVSGPYASCSSPTQTTSPVAATPVLFCESVVATFSAREACATAYWLRWAETQPYSDVLTADGWQRADNIVAVTPARAANPVCWPLKLRAKLEPAPQSQYVLFWACDRTTGVSHYALYFSWERAAEWVSHGLMTAAEYDVAYGQRSREMTDEERVYAYEGPNSLAARFGVRAVVSSNGTAISRPVYALNADGSRNTAAVRGARAAVGARCRHSLRLAGTNWYSVLGLPNIATADPADILGDVYAWCARTDPAGIIN